MLLQLLLESSCEAGYFFVCVRIFFYSLVGLGSGVNLSRPRRAHFEAMVDTIRSNYSSHFKVFCFFFFALAKNATKKTATNKTNIFLAAIHRLVCVCVPIFFDSLVRLGAARPGGQTRPGPAWLGKALHASTCHGPAKPTSWPRWIPKKAIPVRNSNFFAFFAFFGFFLL